MSLVTKSFKYVSLFSCFLADIQLEIFQMIFNWRYLAESFKCVSLFCCIGVPGFSLSLFLSHCFSLSVFCRYSTGDNRRTRELQMRLFSSQKSVFWLFLSRSLFCRYSTEIFNPELTVVCVVISFFLFFWLETGDNGARKSLNFLENVQIKFIKQRHLFQLVPDNKHSVKSSSFFVVLCNWEQQPQWSYRKEWLWISFTIIVVTVTFSSLCTW